MPLMTKIRENLATVFAVFAGVFVVYIVLDWGMNLPAHKQSQQYLESQEIGRINGKSILIQDFSEMVRQAAENQKQQTGSDPDEHQLRNIRDQIWDNLVEEKLIQDETSRLGIKVTDEEIVEWVWNEPPDFLRQQFIDSLGNFNRQAYESAIKDPRNRAVWLKVEEILRKQRLRQKLESVVLSGLRITEGDILQRFCDQNITYDAEYIFFNPNTLVKDEEINITDNDLQQAYSEYADDYRVEATRRLKYVLFRNIPSSSDTQSVQTQMTLLLQRAQSGEDFTELAKQYSETPVSDVFFKHGELSPEKENAIFSAKVGEIIGPILEPNGFHLIKINEFRNGTETFARASHILIHIENNDSNSALKRAQEILIEAKRGGNFAELAKKYSKDPGSADKGGDLGWFGKGRMVKPFEDAVFSAKPGQIVGPIRTPFGYHIIKVVAKDNREVKFTDLHLSIQISSQTYDALIQQASDFAYIAKQEDFIKEAEFYKYQVIETPPFQRQGAIPGLGINPSINRFAFEGKLYDVSDVFRVDNGYVVAMISEIKNAGVRPFEEIKDGLASRVKRNKKLEKVKQIATELRNQIGNSDDLQLLASKNPNLSVQKASQFTAGGSIPGIGRDHKLASAISVLKIGEISQPLEGIQGYYIVKLLSKSSLDSSLYNAQKETIRRQLFNEIKSRYLSEWMENLKKNADIIDRRDLLYR